jgi:hypothetical protein
MRFKTRRNPLKATLYCLPIALLILALAGELYPRSSHVDEYYDAERSAKDLLYSYEDFKKLEKSEIEALVNAICEADEDERRSVSSDIASRAREKVRSEYDKTERRMNEAIGMLKAVIADPRFESKRSDAERLKSEVEEKWKSIDRMWDLLRGSNHPVVSFMLDKGNEEDSYRKGRCTASQVDTGNGYADCVGYDGNACLIIEFKPNNSRAISKGLRQLRDYKQGLENNQSKRQDLNNKSSSFATCSSFETRVDCYTICPQIDSDGNFRSTSTEWATSCR